MFVLDFGGQQFPLLAKAVGGLRRSRSGFFRFRFIGLGKASGGEPNALDPDPRGNFFGAARQLEGPDRVDRIDVQRAVAGNARRPRIPGDRLADRSRPRLDELADAAFRPEAAELALDLVAEVLHRTTAPASPASTSTSWFGSPRPAAALVVVISACPYSGSRSARMRRRSGASSE